MRHLPIEVLESILVQCSPEAVYLATFVCRHWRDVIHHSHFILDATLRRLSSRYGTLILPKPEDQQVEQLRKLFAHLCYTNFLGSWAFITPDIIDVKSLKFRNCPEDAEANGCFSQGLSQIALRSRNYKPQSTIYRHIYGDSAKYEWKGCRYLRFVTTSKGRMYEISYVIKPKDKGILASPYLDYETTALSHITPQSREDGELQEHSSSSPPKKIYEYDIEELEVIKQGIFRPSDQLVDFLTKEFALTTIDSIAKKSDPRIILLGVSNSGTCATLQDNGSITIKGIFSGGFGTNMLWKNNIHRFSSYTGYPLRYPVTVGNCQLMNPPNRRMYRTNALRVSQNILRWIKPVDMAVRDDGVVVLLQEDGLLWLYPWVFLSNQLKPNGGTGIRFRLYEDGDISKDTIIKRIDYAMGETCLLLYPGHLPLHTNHCILTPHQEAQIRHNKLPFFEVLVGSRVRTELYVLGDSSASSHDITVLGLEGSFLRLGPLVFKHLLPEQSRNGAYHFSKFLVSIALDSKTKKFVLVRNETRRSAFNFYDEQFDIYQCQNWKIVAKIDGITEDELQAKYKSHGHRCSKFAISTVTRYTGRFPKIPNFKARHEKYKAIAFAIGNEVYVVCVDIRNVLPVPTSLSHGLHRKHGLCYNTSQKVRISNEENVNFFDEKVKDLDWQKFIVNEPVQEVAWIAPNVLAAFCTTEIVHLELNDRARLYERQRDSYVPFHMKGD